MIENKEDRFQGQKAIVLPENVVSKYCLQNPLTSGAYITEIGYSPKAGFDYRVKQQAAELHMLVYNTEGEGWVEIGDQKYGISAGDFFVVPAGTCSRYAADEKKPWSIYRVHFRGVVADAFVRSIYEIAGAWRGSVAFCQKRVKLFNEMYDKLERGYGQDNLHHVNMVLLHFLSSFLYEDVLNDVSSGEASQDIVNRSIQFMQNNISEPLTLEQLAAQVNISVSHYSNLFRKRSGYSPIEYFNHLKIQKACQYLQFTNMPVKEIALNIGVDDPYYFSRLFTKVMGSSPREYRALH